MLNDLLYKFDSYTTHRVITFMQNKLWSKYFNNIKKFNLIVTEQRKHW